MGAGNNVVNFTNHLKRDFYTMTDISLQLIKENEILKAENERLKRLLKRFTDLGKQQLEEEKSKARPRRRKND